jgi:Tol biopolymer transport system component
MLYDFTARKWEELVKMEAYSPNWSHDGKCVYFSQSSDKRLPVYRVCLNDRRPEHIGNLADAGNLAQVSFAWWVGLGPDDSILTVRDTSIEELYSLDLHFP